MKYFMYFTRFISSELQNERLASVSEYLNKYFTMIYELWTTMYDDECVLDIYMGLVVITDTTEWTFYFNNIVRTKNKDH